MANTAITVGTTAVTAVLFAPTNTAFRVEVADGSGSVQLLSKVGAGAWSHVAMVNAGRSAANFRENRGYPTRILNVLTNLYRAAGWGKGACDDR